MVTILKEILRHENGNWKESVIWKPNLKVAIENQKCPEQENKKLIIKYDRPNKMRMNEGNFEQKNGFTSVLYLDWTELSFWSP